MPLLDRTGFVQDPWVRVSETPPVLETGKFIVPLERARDADAIVAQAEDIGVHVRNDVAVEEIFAVGRAVSLVSVDFPSFADGRGFSLARQLRRHGFDGELRAFGHLIADQFAFALTCGFDTVEISDALAARQPERQWLEALTNYTPPRVANRRGNSALDRQPERPRTAKAMDLPVPMTFCHWG